MRHISRRAAFTALAIRIKCFAGARIFHRQGDPDSAEALLMTCREQVQRVGEAQSAAVEVIETALSGGGAPEPPPTPDPVDLLAECQQMLIDTAAAYATAAQAEADAAAARITELLEAGETRQARRVARLSVAAINLGAFGYRLKLHFTCRDCRNRLRAAGADEATLAALETTCEEQIEAVQQAREAAVQTIRDAFPSEEPEPEPEPA